MGYEVSGGIKAAFSVLPLGRLGGGYCYDSVILGSDRFEEPIGCPQGDVRKA